MSAGTIAGAFTCPVCRRTSCHPEDVAHGFCGACHAFTGDLEPAVAPTMFVCPRCHRRSSLACDRRFGYCGGCHDFTGAEDTTMVYDVGAGRWQLAGGPRPCPAGHGLTWTCGYCRPDPPPGSPLSSREGAAR